MYLTPPPFKFTSPSSLPFSPLVAAPPRRSCVAPIDRDALASSWSPSLLLTVLPKLSFMSAPSELHFGPAELARLIQLQRTTTPADLEPVSAHWREHPLVIYLSPLSWPTRLPGQGKRSNAEMAELREEYKKAFRARTRFAKLFIGTDPFFPISLTNFEGEELGNRPQDALLCGSV